MHTRLMVMDVNFIKNIVILKERRAIPSLLQAPVLAAAAVNRPGDGCHTFPLASLCRCSRGE